MNNDPARDSTPPDDVSDRAIAAAGATMQALLRGEPITRLLVDATSTPDAAYQLLVVLARNIGVILRPGPYEGGPIGESWALVDHGPGARRGVAAVRDGSTAARLIGAGARGDADTTRALALAVVAVGGQEALDQARWVARAMLVIFAREPRLTPEDR